MTLEEQTQEEYDERFDILTKRYFIKYEIPPKIANQYSPEFDSYDISELITENILPDKANRYAELRKTRICDGFHISKLIEWNYPLRLVDKFDSRFHGEGIINILRAGGEPEEANQYNPRFSGYEINHLLIAECPPEIANEYEQNWSGFSIAILYSLGITSQVLSSFDEEKKKRIHYILKGVISESGKREKRSQYSFIGVGSQSVILLKENNAWKFSQNIEKEAMTLKKIKNSHNVIRIKGEVEEELTVRLEYIKGPTLEKLIEKQKTLSSEKVLQYSLDIMNGLIEMRRAGIFYHRDIRPANIMINEKTDTAIIIDLGIATTDRHALPLDNRRYGGPNDLTSLGQVMYKMATGKHLFAKSKSMERTTQAEQLKDHREWIYKNPRRVNYYLEKVDKNIADKQLNTIIKHCIKAKKHQYMQTQRMLQQYTK
ncbi:MAG: protein kinase [DPANN group archaeon]|nr:protein kinase [DPANN group archaeon]